MALLTAVVIALVIGFIPISKRLLHLVNGSFAPTPYSSLALVNPSVVAPGVTVGSSIRVDLTNHTGHTVSYIWVARQKSKQISTGSRTLTNGKSATLYVQTWRAKTGKLTIGIDNSHVFLTVPLIGTNR
jgi:hypothetical protein